MLRLLGALLLLGACTGGGVAVWAAHRRTWQEVRTFSALLETLLAAIRYQAWPCAQLLALVARDAQFAALHLEGCRSFADIPVPDALGPALQAETRRTMAELGRVPRQRACALLSHLLEKYQIRETALCRQTEEAWRLCPRLGLCAGVLAVLFLL